MGGVRSYLAPASNKGRVHHHDPFWNGKKKAFAIAVTTTFVLIQLLFLGNLSYLNGALWRDGDKVHNLNVLLVDFDQGIIGESLRSAYSTLQAQTFPTLYEHNTTEYPDADSIRHAVYKGDYWGAIYATAGASDRLSAALAGGDAATSYVSSDAIVYVLNSARYPTITQGDVLANLEILVVYTRLAYNTINGTQALLSIADEQAAAVLLDPVEATDIDIKETDQGPRVIYNTISIVFPAILQFFFLMAVNGISQKFQVYSHLPLLDNGLLRIGMSLSYTFIGGLCTSAYIYAFREAWDISVGQFFLVWMVFWLYMHIHFVVLDCATTFIPMAFVTFFMLTWIVLNVTSSLVPFEVSPNFYKWGYALPGYNTYSLLIQIWSGGGYSRIYRTLPILFGWEIVMAPLVGLAVHVRCKNAAAEARAIAETNAARGTVDDRVAKEDSEKEASEDGEVGTSSTRTHTAEPTTSRRESTLVDEAPRRVLTRTETSGSYLVLGPLIRG